MSISGNNTIAGNNSFTGTNTFTNSQTFTQAWTTGGSSGNAPIVLKSGLPAIQWVNTSGAADAKTWDIYASATDFIIRIDNDAGSATKNVLDVVRSGNALTAMAIGNTTDKAPITLNGNVTIPAPASGDALNSTAFAGRIAGIFNGASGNDTVEIINTTGGGTSFGLLVKAGSTSADYAVDVTDHLGTSAFFTLKGDGSFLLGNNGSFQTITGTSAGNVTVAKPSSGVALLLSSGAANSYTLQAQASSTSGQSLGVAILAGTTSGDNSLLVVNQANTRTYFQVRGDGVLLGGGPVAGAPVDMTPDTGTFTGTLTGMTTTITGTCTWSRIGKLVILHIPAMAGASNTATMTMTGLPAAIQPATLSPVLTCAGICIINNGTAGSSNDVVVQITAGSGTVGFFLGATSGTTFTASGVKGVNAPFQISYLLN